MVKRRRRRTSHGRRIMGVALKIPTLEKMRKMYKMPPIDKAFVSQISAKNHGLDQIIGIRPIPGRQLPKNYRKITAKLLASKKHGCKGGNADHNLREWSRRLMDEAHRRFKPK